ncbi:hydroxysteroid dehydrogenase-like protein 3, partial [Leptotrombidium deliense]
MIQYSDNLNKNLRTFKLFVYSCLTKFGLLSIYSEYVAITGEPDEIGLEFAKQFAERGHSVVLIGRNVQKLKNATDFVSKYLHFGRKVSSIVADLNSTDSTVYHNITSQLKENVGILINIAGVFTKPNCFLNRSDDEITQNVRVNVYGVLMLTKAVLPFMVSSKRGLVVNVSSQGAIIPVPLEGIYLASKIY